MKSETILKKVKRYVKNLYKQKALQGNKYHNIIHTLEVVDVSTEIALAERMTAEQIEIIKIAAWFHDTGHFICCNGHEDQSSIYARNFLTKELYPIEKIGKVIGCIISTKVPQNPKNKMEEIICDADLHHLGLSDLEEKGEVLRLEFEKRGVIKFTDIEWLRNSIKFISSHQFFTKCAKNKYGPQKKINIQILERKLKKLEKNIKQS